MFLGASETIRQGFSIIKFPAALNLVRKYSSIPKTAAPNKNFNYYLAGLIEGDGTIFVPNFQRDKKARLTYPSIQIVFGLMDLPLALMIQKTLGCGDISRKKGSRAYTYTINNKEGLVKTISIVNGKFKTDKIESLGKLIDWFKVKGDIEFNLKPIDNTPLDNSSWLSGFIEAVGFFSLRATESLTYNKVECKFELSQTKKGLYGESHPIMKEISEILICPLKEFRTTSSNPQYRVRTLNSNSNLILINYLVKYPLKGKKFLDFISWLEIAKVFIRGKVNHKQLVPQAKEIKYHMNDNRKFFTWDHLDEFYNIEK